MKRTQHRTDEPVRFGRNSFGSLHMTKQTTNNNAAGATQPADSTAAEHRIYCGHTAEGTPGKIPHRNVTGLYCYDCAAWVATMPSTSPPFKQEPQEPPLKATGFTPGPWHIRNSRVQAGGNYIADCDASYFFSDEQRQANARLIAAAPDLLSALERCLPFVDSIRAMSGGDGDMTAWTARSVIAAAKGETL